MDKLTEYPKLLKRILAEYLELCNRRLHPELEAFLTGLPDAAIAFPKGWNSRIAEGCK